MTEEKPKKRVERKNSRRKVLKGFGAATVMGFGSVLGSSAATAYCGKGVKIEARYGSLDYTIETVNETVSGYIESKSSSYKEEHKTITGKVLRMRFDMVGWNGNKIDYRLRFGDGLDDYDYCYRDSWEEIRVTEHDSGRAGYTLCTPEVKKPGDGTHEWEEGIDSLGCGYGVVDNGYDDWLVNGDLEWWDGGGWSTVTYEVL